MNKIAVAFCEEDDTYRNRFVTYLMEHKAKEIAVYAFSAVKPFLEEAKKQKFDVIILGTGFAELAKALWEMKFPVLLLKDTAPEQVAESEGYQENGIPILQTVFRFQNMESIVHEIFVLSHGEPIGEVAVRISGVEILGVYSPVRHEMQMPFSMVLAQLMAERGKALYLNLMENNGFMELFGFDGRYDMGDVIIRLRDHRMTPEDFRKYVYETDRISYIPPFPNMENLHELLFSDFLSLIRFIQEETDIRIVIIDFGGSLDCFSGMLEICTGIYCPVKNGFFYECQIKCFLDYISKMPKTHLRDRIQLVDVPYSAKNIRGGGDVMRQLLYSEFGDYVRGYFSGRYCERKSGALH